MKPLDIKTFGRIVYALDGKAKPHQPLRMTNFNASSSRLKFRYGYTSIVAAPSPGDPFSCLGFGFVQNKSGVAEFLGIENHDGTILPYTYNKSTLARIALGSSTLAGGDWVIASYADNAYLINPGGTKTVYRHQIGSLSSPEAIEDTSYVGSTDPNFSLVMEEPLNLKSWDTAVDTLTFVNSNAYVTSPNKTWNADGSILLNGDSTDGGGDAGGTYEVTVTYSASVDYSGHDYLYLVLTGEAYLKYFTDSSVKPQFKIGASWVDATDAKFVKSDSGTKKAAWHIYTNGMTLTSVDGFRFVIPCKPNRGAPHGPLQDFVTISPIYGGGTYLEASASTKRLWDTTLDGDGITYGIMFSDGASTTSAIIQQTITKSEALGYRSDTYGYTVGGIPQMSSTVPETPYDRTIFMRLDESVDPPEWKELDTQTSGFVYVDRAMEFDVPGLTTVATGTAPVSAPTFRTAGIVSAFPFKQFMVWLVSGGESNVQMSRVGNAEELYDSAQTYDATDLTQPGARTLADNADDEPVWGTQAGDVAVIVGKKAAYVMHGDYPVQMSPTRQIAGSRGIIGPFAGVRFRIGGGQYAAAYCDPDFNVWVVQSIPQFQGDGRGLPVELSLAVRGLLRDFLYYEQRLLNPSLDATKVQLEFDEEFSTLWVILGNRAAAYRQDMNEPGWELYSYSLRSDGSTTVETWTPYTGNAAVASSVSPGDAAFSNFGYPFASDDAYCESASLPSGTGKKTETLRIDGFVPDILVPASATILGVEFEVERSQTGDYQMTETKVQPRKASASWGSDLTVNELLTSTDATTEFLITSSLPSVSEINSGALGIDLQYTQEDVNAAWNIDTNWSISFTGSTVFTDSSATTCSLTRTMNVSYIGPGTAPSKVKISVYSHPQSTFALQPAPPTYLGRTVIDNGIGTVSTTDLYLPSPSYGTADSTKVFEIPLVGGSGSQAFTATGTNTSSTGSGMMFNFYIEGAFVPFTPPTVRVDNVNMRVHYSVTSEFSPSWVGWDQACFTADGRRVAVRSTGEIDLIEKDFRNDSFISGTNRDGGYAPPDGEWYSQNIEADGNKIFFNKAFVNSIAPDDAFGVFSKTNSATWVEGLQVGYSTSRWWRFPLSQTAFIHNFKLTMPEASEGVTSMSFELTQQSKSRTV